MQRTRCRRKSNDKNNCGSFDFTSLRFVSLSDCLFCQEVESNWEAGIEFFQAWAIYPSDVMAGSEPEDSLPGAHRLG
jgi:hypothetical protein